MAWNKLFVAKSQREVRAGGGGGNFIDSFALNWLDLGSPNRKGVAKGFEGKIRKEKKKKNPMYCMRGNA